MVHRARKFSAVLGTTSANSSMTMRPASLPLMVTSKNTLGFAGFVHLLASDADMRSPSPARFQLAEAILHFFSESQSHSSAAFSASQSRRPAGNHRHPARQG